MNNIRLDFKVHNKNIMSTTVLDFFKEQFKERNRTFQYKEVKLKNGKDFRFSVDQFKYINFPIKLFINKNEATCNEILYKTNHIDNKFGGTTGKDIHEVIPLLKKLNIISYDKNYIITKGSKLLRNEHIFMFRLFKHIENIFPGIQISTQFKVHTYLCDACIEINNKRIMIEYDENHHKNRSNHNYDKSKKNVLLCLCEYLYVYNETTDFDEFFDALCLSIIKLVNRNKNASEGKDYVAKYISWKSDITYNQVKFIQELYFQGEFELTDLSGILKYSSDKKLLKDFESKKINKKYFEKYDGKIIIKFKNLNLILAAFYEKKEIHELLSLYSLVTEYYLDILHEKSTIEPYEGDYSDLEIFIKEEAECLYGPDPKLLSNKIQKPKSITKIKVIKNKSKKSKLKSNEINTILGHDGLFKYSSGHVTSITYLKGILTRIKIDQEDQNKIIKKLIKVTKSSNKCTDSKDSVRNLARCDGIMAKIEEYNSKHNDSDDNSDSSSCSTDSIDDLEPEI